MEKYKIERDLHLFYVKASSFPMGVGAAFQQLHALIPDAGKRTAYGISHPDGPQGIVYKAAVEEAFPGEGAEKGCETFLVKKGEYLSEVLTDWKKDESSVGRTFQELLRQSETGPGGYCLEIYSNPTDVRCLVVPTA
ncbi:transcriptional regulator [Chitinophaga vietnamensis]|uniref:transcriptional regulator n=1 Tax=Chitinophaga vietnamensis TaxID=2593957 RepID=UPI0011779BA2|nr:transcriptional regulator [Chitinophaga vietnamensis]